jgi:hypothetical protein
MQSALPKANSYFGECNLLREGRFAPIRVCGEFALRRRQAIGTGLGSDFASGKNLDLQPWVVSS